MSGIRITGALALAALVGLGGCDAMDTDTTGPESRQLLSAPGLAEAHMAGTDGAQLAMLRRATAGYHRINAALDDGFFAPDECVEVPGVGGMGVHYVHMDRINDGVADPSAPDVLLYEPQENGRMRLVGVEFVIWRADWTESSDPSFLGRPFDRSFGEDSHGLPDHYELHVWIW
ncbi:MAG: hypothetical protein R3314_11170, partial [Longimicrobiales bacterium]|nr:hypothetical protein [Longimicrobiales bacterium]